MLRGHLTSDDAAARLGVTRRTLYNLAKSEEFPKPKRVGRTLMWSEKGLDKWREKHPARKKRRPKSAPPETPTE